MEELERFEIVGLSRAEFLDLRDSIPGGKVEAISRERRVEDLGALDPITAAVIVTLGLATIHALAAWLSKNRAHRTYTVIRQRVDGTREEIVVNLESAVSEADVLEALAKGMPKPPTFGTPI